MHVYWCMYSVPGFIQRMQLVSVSLLARVLSSVYVHLCAYLFICVHLCTAAYICVQLCTTLFVCVHLCTAVYIYVQLCVSVFSCTEYVFIPHVGLTHLDNKFEKVRSCAHCVVFHFDKQHPCYTIPGFSLCVSIFLFIHLSSVFLK